MATLSVGGTTVFDGATLQTGVTFPAGHIIQTVYSQKIDSNAISVPTGLVDIPGTDQDGNGSIFCATITPSSTSNKILVSVSLNIAGKSSYYNLLASLLRGSTEIGLSNASGSRPRGFIVVGAQDWGNYFRYQAANSFLDSPGVDTSVTYKLAVNDPRDQQVVNINRQHYDANDASSTTGTSFILLQEVVA